MKKNPRFRPLTDTEKEQLQRERKQMWSTVPPHALARARELAGVQPGEEPVFRNAFVLEEENTSFMDYPLGIVNLRAGVADGMVNGEQAKLLNLQLQIGERAWQINDGVYAKRFRSIEQSNNWLAAIEKYVLSHLPERLRDTCFTVWTEAVAKASDQYGVRKIDLTALAEAHTKEIRQDMSKALSIRPGAKKGSKQSKQSLTKKQVAIDLPEFIRENGEDTTREQAIARFGFNNLKAFDRALARHGKRWRKLKVEALMERKKGH